MTCMGTSIKMTINVTSSVSAKVQKENVYSHPDILEFGRIPIADGNYTNSFGRFWHIIRA